MQCGNITTDEIEPWDDFSETSKTMIKFKGKNAVLLIATGNPMCPLDIEPMEKDALISTLKEILLTMASRIKTDKIILGEVEIAPDKLTYLYDTLIVAEIKEKTIEVIDSEGLAYFISDFIADNTEE